MDYNFISRERFEAMIADGDLLEHARCSATCTAPAPPRPERALAGGDDLVLVIDVQGARKVRATGFEHVGIFVLPPSFEVLEERLRRRSKDSEAQIQRRLAVAQQEVAAVAEYEYVVINDDVDSARRAAARHRRSGTLAAARDAAEGRRDHRELPRRAAPRLNTEAGTAPCL